MTEHQSFYDKVSAFFSSYIAIPQTTYYYEINGNLTKRGIKDCANFLISGGIFSGANDIKAQALKDFSIILPDWVFEDEKGAMPNE